MLMKVEEKKKNTPEIIVALIHFINWTQFDVLNSMKTKDQAKKKKKHVYANVWTFLWYKHFWIYNIFWIQRYI